MRVPLSWVSVGDLLGPDDGPIVFEQPTRPSTLKGRVVRRREKRPCADSPEEIAAMIAANDCV